jgi:hypothetical protein
MASVGLSDLKAIHMRKTLPLQTFVERLSTVTRAVSITGRASYHSIYIASNELVFTRESTQKRERIDVQELYTAYAAESFINTVILRKHLSRRQYSPALAILISSGLYDAAGYLR